MVAQRGGIGADILDGHKLFEHGSLLESLLEP